MAFFDTPHRYEIVDTETGNIVEKGRGKLRAAKRIAILYDEYVSGYRTNTSNIMPGAPYEIRVDRQKDDPYLTLSVKIDQVDALRRERRRCFR